VCVLTTDDTNFVTEEHTEYASFLFSWVFCSTTATIVSGSVASRILFSAYMIITFFVSVIIYPIVSMWGKSVCVSVPCSVWAV